MLTSAFNAVLRLGLRLVYPIVCRAERVLGIETEVATVAVWHDGAVLMIRNSYRSQLTLPGGHIGTGESAVAAAVRELHEEAGVRIDAADVRPAYAETVLWDRRRDRCAIFETVLTDRPAVRIDNREVVWADFLPAAEALAANPTPHVRAYLERRRDTNAPPPIDPDPSAT